MASLRPARLPQHRHALEFLMLDILLLGLGAGFFVLMAVYAAVCGRV